MDPDNPEPKKPRRHYRKFFGAQHKLDRIRKIREDAKTRTHALVEERRLARIAAGKAARSAQKALEKALKAKPPPDPDDSPERQQARKEAKRAKGAAKGQPTLPGRKHQGSLGAEDVALILALKEREATNREIATVLNIGADTVARALAEFRDTRTIAKAYLHEQAESIAQHAVLASREAATKGDADPALELLDRLDVAPKRSEDAHAGKVMIIVGSNSLAALPSFPVLDGNVE